MLWVKNLIASHDRHQIFRLRQVDDVMRPAGNHMDSFNFIPENLKLHRLSGIDVALLNQTMTSHYDEQFPLAVVPMLPLGDTWSADVNGHLSAVCRVNQLGKRATVVHIHLQGILKFLRWQVGQIKRI